MTTLGWTNAVRFLHQYETSKHDYTKERDMILPDWEPRPWRGKDAKSAEAIRVSVNTIMMGGWR